MSAPKPQWASQMSFIFAASAAAIGLGNIWRFPYMVGENGGGLFVITYLICIVLLALPLIFSEIIIGRDAKCNPMAAFALMAQRSNKSKLWGIVGLLSILTGFFIMTYYVVIAGWVVDYTVRAAIGQFSHATEASSKLAFKMLQSNPYEMLAATSFVILASLAVNMMGIKAGIERAVLFMFPALLIIMFCLLGYAISTGYFHQALNFLFNPSHSKFSIKTVLLALGQAFFSLNIGMGVTLMFSAYLPEGVSTKTAGISIAIADTGFALLAGLIIFPIVFANHLQASAGPSLIFQTLPIAFGHMPGGTIIATLFFLMLFFAAFSSIIAVLEPAICWLIETCHLSRKLAVLIVMMACWLVSFLTIGSFSHKPLFSIQHKTYFEHIDFITASIMLPVIGLSTALFSGWLLKKEIIKNYLKWDTSCFYYKTWEGLLRYFAPLAIILILLSSL
ncbi:MAG: sodium-dependent transporter [Coxiella sp. (in: Bacteria)]|nr:MAG: sodium-dependent transporter [Coxiella sp. (in: g-proteobacteria)]